MTGGGRRAFWIGVTVGLLLAAVGAATWWVVALRPGVPLGASERAHLLQRSGLPEDFPIHPAARRMPQAPQGGLSYSVTAPVPDVTTWVRDALKREGYQVETADLEGDVEAEYKDRLLSYGRRRGPVMSSGLIIVRQMGSGAYAPTEVKILSQQDERLKPPPTPTTGARGGGSS
jgi:hypothetical protein